MDKRLGDKNYRVNHLYTIQNKAEQKIQFKRNRAQEHYAKHKHSRNIILKSRQLGFTTDEAIDSLDDTLFTRNKNALFIAHVDYEAKKIFDTKINYAWSNINPVLQKLWKVDAANANTLKFDFGDGTISSITVSISGRSGTYGRVHVTEFAKMCKKYPERAKEVISGTIPAVPTTGRIDIESTSEGDSGYFYDMFWEAWDRGEPTLPVQFKAHFYNWTWDDEELARIKPIAFEEMESGEKFREYAKQHKLSQTEITYYYHKWISLQKDWNLLRQEYPTTPDESFISSGNKFFNMDMLQEYASQVKEGVTEGELTVYKGYDSRWLYCIGVDVSEGIGQDSSTIAVWGFNRVDPTVKPTLVAEFISNKIPADQLAFPIRDLGNKYGTCMVAVERNNHGLATLNALKAIYPPDAIYTEERVDEKTKVKTKKMGWHTTRASKPMMLYDFKTAFDQGLFTIPSKRLLSEVRTYSQDDLNETAVNENATQHWDLLTAAVIGWQMRKHMRLPQATQARRVAPPKRGYGLV